VYLATATGRFQWIVFDLDVSRGGVARDLAALEQLLEEAGLRYVVAASGPGGGRHVWVTASKLLPARPVTRIGRPARVVIPALDHGLLCNSRTVAVRPVGAPHRHGGRSRLLRPADQTMAARLLSPQTCGNSALSFSRLAALLDGPVGRADSAAGQAVSAPPAVSSREHSQAARGRSRVIREAGAGSGWPTSAPAGTPSPPTAQPHSTNSASAGHSTGRALGASHWHPDQLPDKVRGPAAMWPPDPSRVPHGAAQNPLPTPQAIQNPLLITTFRRVTEPPVVGGFGSAEIDEDLLLRTHG
jgi:hypothetical protein